MYSTVAILTLCSNVRIPKLELHYQLIPLIGMLMAMHSSQLIALVVYFLVLNP